MSCNLDKLVNRYLDAKVFIIQEGYDWEIDWQTDRSIEKLTEKEFLKEAAWVILSSGFRESVVRRLFPMISEAFLNWISATDIYLLINDCRKRATKYFKNERKINAICEIIRNVAEDGFSNIRLKIQNEGLEYIKRFPYIGPITGLHLLKNLGIQSVKPDRHLVRIANVSGFKAPQDMCEAIKDTVGDNLAEIDIVLWRYATLNTDYTNHFKMLN